MSLRYPRPSLELPGTTGDVSLTPSRATLLRATHHCLLKYLAHDDDVARMQVPRDTAQLYAQLAKSGLQYGPAFRLLRNVHVPDTK